MNEVKILVQDDQMLVSSRDVASDFGKRHDKLLHEIERMYGHLIDNLDAQNGGAKFLFYKTTFENRGKQYPMYLMNRDGFSLLVMGFTGKKALDWKLKYINAFNEMEQTLNSPQKIMARALEIANQELNALRIENKEMKVKADFADAVQGSSTSIPVGEMAKILKQNGIDIGQHRLYKALRNESLLMKRKSSWNLPTQVGMNKGIFEIKEKLYSYPNGVNQIRPVTMITAKGQSYLVNKFLNSEVVA